MNQLVTMTLDDALLGIDVGSVQDVVRLGRVTPVPLALPWIAGMMNLRGHIVTAVDLRCRLDLPPAPESVRQKCVVVTVGKDAFGLIVDAVEEVITIDPAQREPEPATLGARWRGVSRGIVQGDDRLLIELDPVALIDSDEFQAAA